MRLIRRHIAFLAVVLALSSCLEDALTDTVILPCSKANDEREMQLMVKLPEVSRAPGVGISHEESIDTLDVLVFETWPTDHSKKGLVKAITGTPVMIGSNKVPNLFTVPMPIGSHYDVHVFANSHMELVRSGVFGFRGREMETVLEDIISSKKYSLQEPDAVLPMHGFEKDITISADSTERDTIRISVLRSIAKVSAMLNGSISDSKLTGGTLEKDNFKLYEMYVFFPADRGRVATADTTKFITSGIDIGNVYTPTLPTNFKGGNRSDSLSIIKSSSVKQIESIYMYENIPWGDGPDTLTTRVVLGGVFHDDIYPNYENHITYYRVNFSNINDLNQEEHYSILRNHHYIFNVISVAAPGYETPRQAAEGKSININVNIIPWKDELNNIEYDGQSFFKVSNKNVTLARNEGSKKVIKVESDVDVDKWKMYFANTANGVTVPKTWYKDKFGNDSISGTTGIYLQNNRYKIYKENTKIIVEALKDYNNLGNNESHSDTLIIMAKNLRIHIFINQKDWSPEDWGNGGDQNTELGSSS